MKTYKEINECIVTSDILKKDTVDYLKKKSTNNKFNAKRLAFSGIIIVFMLFIGVEIININTDNKASYSSVFELNDYMTDQKDKLHMSSAQVDGVIEMMDRTTLRKISEQVPDLQQLYFPDGFQTKIYYEQYSNKEAGPFPIITYQSNGENNEQINVILEDQRIPQPFKFDKASMRPYKDYKLIIYHMTDEDGKENYWLNGEKGNYRISVYACVSQSKEFERFLASFLK